MEVKTDRINLVPSQIEDYLDIAREQGFQAVITISNEIATITGEHPTSVDKKKLRKVVLHHLSWSQIHTEAVIERVNHSVSDPDQAWILSELIRYLEHPQSGAVDFDDMGSGWVPVRDGVTNGTLRPGDAKVSEVVGRFGQLIAFSGMRLSRKLGVDVRPALTRAQLSDNAKRLQVAATELINSGTLRGSLKVPHAISPIDVVVDLKSGRTTCAITIDAPAQGKPTTRINWLVRQLNEAPGDLLIEAFPAWARSGPCHQLSAVRVSPHLLFDDPKKDLKTFVVRLSAPAGTKRGQGQGSFVGTVLELIDKFYIGVVQNLKPWSAPAPSVRTSSAGDQTFDEDAIQGELPVRPGRNERGTSDPGSEAVRDRSGLADRPDSNAVAGITPSLADPSAPGIRSDVAQTEWPGNTYPVGPANG